VTGPIVHAANARLGRTDESLGLRVALPLASGLIGMLASPDPWGCSEGDRCIVHSGLSRGALIGGMLGMAGAVVFDASILAHGDPGSASDAPQLQGLGPWMDRGGRLGGVHVSWVF
jgi:hypothetical protein